MEASRFQGGMLAFNTVGAGGSPTFQPFSLGPGLTHKLNVSPEELFWLLSNPVKSSTVTAEKGCPLPTTSRPSISLKKSRKKRLAEDERHPKGLQTGHGGITNLLAKVQLCHDALQLLASVDQKQTPIPGVAVPSVLLVQQS